MHSDGAAQRHRGRRDSALDARVDAACAAARPGAALHGLARALRDEGHPQRALYDLFEAHRARRCDDADEAAFDGLCDAMDAVCGWHAGAEQRLFAVNSLPQARSRAREWEEAREEARAEREAGERRARETVPTPAWQGYAAVAALLLAVASVHATVAMALSALAPAGPGAAGGGAAG